MSDSGQVNEDRTFDLSFGRRFARVRRNYLLLRLATLPAAVLVFLVSTWAEARSSGLPFESAMIFGVLFGIGAFVILQPLVDWVFYRCPKCRQPISHGWLTPDRGPEVRRRGVRERGPAEYLEFARIEALLNRPGACPHCTADFSEPSSEDAA